MSNLWVKVAAYGSGDKPTWLDMDGEHEIDTDNHPIRTLPVEQIQKGDLVRPAWAGHMPFQRAKGPSVHDPSHPSDTSKEEGEDGTRMFTPSYQFTYGPHVPEGSHFHVVRGHA